MPTDLLAVETLLEEFRNWPGLTVGRCKLSTPTPASKHHPGFFKKFPT